MTDLERYVSYVTSPDAARPQCIYLCDDQLVFARDLGDDEARVWVIKHGADCPGIAKHPAT